jgi:ABC-type polysaccharide/polyol phosphate transport system ATPase subunit
VIEVQHLWKQYRRPHLKVTSLKEAVIAFLRGQTGYTQFWALQDVSFTVKSGEAVGVIGANGSGKSTLFAIIARVLQPTRGTLKVDGKVCPLLELGTGFHPELTGRDNVYLNASILGLSHDETRERYDSIVDFAELAEVMDAPVKTYSTGMIVRLGFSVAVHMDPEVLLIDEVLTVGDEHFQHKSFSRLQQFKQAGKTIFVVSHDLVTVQRLCERTIWLDHGQMQMDGATAKVADAYRAAVAAQERASRPGQAESASHAPAG